MLIFFNGPWCIQSEYGSDGPFIYIQYLDKKNCTEIFNFARMRIQSPKMDVFFYQRLFFLDSVVAQWTQYLENEIAYISHWTAGSLSTFMSPCSIRNSTFPYQINTSSFETDKTGMIEEVYRRHSLSPSSPFRKNFHHYQQTHDTSDSSVPPVSWRTWSCDLSVLGGSSPSEFLTLSAFMWSTTHLFLQEGKRKLSKNKCLSDILMAQ